MDDGQILSELLLESTIVSLEDDPYNNPIVKLEEPGVSGSEACVHHIPQDAIVIKSDEFPAPKHFFKDTKNECKRADYIIVCPSDKVVLYIELKTGPKDSAFIEKQLKGAACVFTYCKEIGQRFWDNDQFLEGYAHRFIGIVKTSLNVRPSRQKKDEGSVHDCPQNFLKETAPHHLQFNKLAAL